MTVWVQMHDVAALLTVIAATSPCWVLEVLDGGSGGIAGVCHIAGTYSWAEVQSEPGNVHL